MAACGSVIAAQQSLSPGGVFGVIALIAAAVYLLGGIAYQRTVMHQRGWRQLPNYTLWAGIFGFLNVGAFPQLGLYTFLQEKAERAIIADLFAPIGRLHHLNIFLR